MRGATVYIYKGGRMRSPSAARHLALRTTKPYPVHGEIDTHIHVCNVHSIGTPVCAVQIYTQRR